MRSESKGGHRMTKRITIFDYGAGNLHSLAKALDVGGVTVAIESDPVAAIDTDLLVLPGVGAFSHAANRLAPGRTAMRDAILNGLPTLGICLGMQLFFEKSEEGPGEGLGVIPGEVRKLKAERVPHIGWNAVEIDSPSWKSLAPSTMMYFANSYVCDPTDPLTIAAYTTHEQDRFVAAVSVANAIGVQFHPEKSSTAGLQFVHTIVKEAV
jgi:glutamine amidotransferase